MSQPPTQPAPKKRHTVRTIGIVLGSVAGLLIVVGIISAIVSPSKTTTARRPSATQTTSLSPASTAVTSAAPARTRPSASVKRSSAAPTSAVPSSKVVATTVAAPVTTKATVATRLPTTKALAPPPPPKPVTQPVVYSGTGDDVVSIRKPNSGPTLLTASYTGGQSNFVVQDVGANQLLVNTIGSYQGTTLLDPNGEDTRRLQVTATGPWTIKLAPLTSAPIYRGGTYQGAGDTVLVVPNGSTATFTSGAAQANFVVTEYGSDGTPNLLVNAIAPPAYHGTVPLSPPSFLVVQAVGAWTMTTG